LDEQPKQQKQPARALLTRALQRARGSLLWERLWPALAALATALGLFLAFSWAGLWVVLPPLARAIGLVLFVVVTAIAAAPLAMLRWPSAGDGLRRFSGGKVVATGTRHTAASLKEVIEQGRRNLGQEIRITKAAMSYAWKNGGESAGLHPGDQLTAQQLRLPHHGADERIEHGPVDQPRLVLGKQPLEPEQQ